MSEKKGRCAYQGEPGAYSEGCAADVFAAAGRPCEFVGLGSFDEVFASLAAGNVDYAAVPVENTLGGSIHVNGATVSGVNTVIGGSGAISATERTCQPQRCATVTPEQYGFGPVPEDAFKACPDEDTGDDIDHVDDEDIVDDDTNDDIDPDDNTGDETGNNQDGWDIDDNGENSAEIEDGCQSTTNGGLPGAGIWLALGLLFGLRRRKQS